MIVVAGLSVKNLPPRVWDEASPDYLNLLTAVMVSYAELNQRPAIRRSMVTEGLRKALKIPDRINIYLDNGSFYFIDRTESIESKDYENFVRAARPDWYPIPRDVIPSPRMSIEEQHRCLEATMAANRQFLDDGFVPVIHISQVLEEYIDAIQSDPILRSKTALALGGIVPNLLRMPKARPYRELLVSVRRVREAFADQEIHLFGVGGTATLHLAALLGIDSVDSSGWRNRAARGIVQLPGRGDRLIAELGKWRGRQPSAAEFDLLAACQCPACLRSGLDGLRANRRDGFCNRATHNLWVLLMEAAEVDRRIVDGTYLNWFEGHLDNSIYLPLIRLAASWRFSEFKAPAVP